MNLNKILSTKIILLCFVVASVATMGSLFFSDVMGFVPCNMCWYQRIFMYPLVIIFLINILYPDDKVYKYAFPIVLVGLLFAIYHNLLMFGLIPESAVPCASGVPCSTEYINWLGFITIPFLSLISYLVLFLLLVLSKEK
jgi:disulfide bond formation protein DsbB